MMDAGAGRQLFDPHEVTIQATSTDEFAPIRLIGTGTFGKVTVVQHKRSGMFVALKSMKKEDVVRLKQVEHVFNEKDILLHCRHPYIVRLYCTFNDQQYLHLVMEYVNGGELFTRLRKVGALSPDVARFYSAQIVLALEYLHQNMILYRDLKPENVLIDSRGYLRLADFGFAKKVEDRTWTLCGTPEYLAPEVIQSKGYGRPVDWWAFGVILFEMLVGYPPFYDDNPFGIYEKILAVKVHFPGNLDSNAKDLIKKLLVIDKTKRFGCMKNGASDVKEHKFYHGLNWNDLYHKRLPAPYVPPVKTDGDTSNFGEFDENTVGNLPPQYVPKPPTQPADLAKLFANF